MLLLVGLLAAACSGENRPEKLLYGGRAAEFRPVPGSVLTAARTLRGATLGSRLEDCLAPVDSASIRSDSLVVERVGVGGESLTFGRAGAAGVYACDGGADPAGERPLPWCGVVFGEREAGRLLDPRLDVNCRDRQGGALAYVFVEPVAGAHWIGVEQGGYVEVYEALAGLPVRIASTRGIDVREARAVFEITQYDDSGRELVHGKLEAGVAG